MVDCKELFGTSVQGWMVQEGQHPGTTPVSGYKESPEASCTARSAVRRELLEVFLIAGYNVSVIYASGCECESKRSDMEFAV